MTELPYYKLYPSDFMGSGKVQMMNATAFGIYQALLNYSWQEGPLPDSPALLWRVSKADSLEQFEQFWPLIRKCWVETDAGLVNDRLEKERTDALDRRSKAIKAARARHADAHADAGADGDALAEHEQSASNAGSNAWVSARVVARDMPSHSSESHSTENREQNSESHTAREPGSAVVRKLRALYGWRGTEGTDRVLLKAFPKDEDARDRCLEIAFDRWETDAAGQPFNSRFFRSILTTVVDEQVPAKVGGVFGGLGEE